MLCATMQRHHIFEPLTISDISKTIYKEKERAVGAKTAYHYHQLTKSNEKSNENERFGIGFGISEQRQQYE